MDEKIMQLQITEQNLQGLIAQKQNFQAQLSEIENALKEVKESKDSIFKVVGNTLISVPKSKVEKDFASKKEILDLKIKSFERQEKQTKEKFEELQKEVLKNIKK